MSEATNFYRLQYDFDESYFEKKSFAHQASKLPGLGLTVSKLICQKMRTMLKCSSKINVGTRFFFSLENLHYPKRPHSRELKLDSIENDYKMFEDSTFYKEFSQSIFGRVVDDMGVNRNVLTCYLRKIGINHSEAQNGEESVIQFQQISTPKNIIVFMDLQMRSWMEFKQQN